MGQEVRRAVDIQATARSRPVLIVFLSLLRDQLQAEHDEKTHLPNTRKTNSKKKKKLVPILALGCPAYPKSN
jgi:hypothetical protein